MHADDRPVGHLLLLVESDCAVEPKHHHTARAVYPFKLLNLIESCGAVLS